MKARSYLLFLILITAPTLCFAQVSKRQVRNLKAFSKAMGYIQYFHPSDEAAVADWDDIAINGTQLMLDVKDDLELVQKLEQIFLPIAPSLKFSRGNNTLKFKEVQNLQDSGKKFLPLYWQHLGFNLYAGIAERPYYSIRINRTSLLPQKNDFRTNLTGKYDVSGYRGLPFEVHVSVSCGKGIQQPISLGLVKEAALIGEVQSVDVLEDKIYHFKGLLDQSAKQVTFSVNSNLSFPVSFSKAELFVIKDGRTIKLQEETGEIAAEKVQDFTLAIISADLPLFKQQLDISSYLKTDLVGGIHFLMPMAIPTDQFRIVPKTYVSSKFLQNLPQAIPVREFYTDHAFAYQALRIADVILLWNMLKHSFPYWEDIDIPAEKILEFSLLSAARPQSPADFVNTVKRMTNYYNDSHMFVTATGIDTARYGVPLSLIKIGDQIIIKDVLNSKAAREVSAGDILEAINNRPVKAVIDSIMNYFSGSPQMKTALSLNSMLEGTKTDSTTLRLKNGKLLKQVILANDAPVTFRVPGNSGYLQRKNEWVTPKTYYFDLTRNSLHDDNFKILQQADTVIFDLRGYPFDQTISANLIESLIKESLVVSRIFTPEILYPDYKKVHLFPNTETYVPSETHHLKAKVYVLADASAQSAAESLLGLIKDFHLATIIGTPTSGANGDINIAFLPGKLQVNFSGALFKNADGSKHHLKGVLPDIYMEQTLEAVRNRKDALLLKAISLGR